MQCYISGGVLYNNIRMSGKLQAPCPGPWNYFLRRALHVSRAFAAATVAVVVPNMYSSSPLDVHHTRRHVHVHTGATREVPHVLPSFARHLCIGRRGRRPQLTVVFGPATHGHIYSGLQNVITNAYIATSRACCSASWWKQPLRPRLLDAGSPAPWTGLSLRSKLTRLVWVLNMSTLKMKLQPGICPFPALGFRLITPNQYAGTMTFHRDLPSTTST